jgi:hypothetical protein
MITIHENQRATNMLSRLLSMQQPKYSSAALNRSDNRAPWTKPPTNEPCTLDEVTLPSNDSRHVWFWLTEWQPDIHHPRTDDEGFEYAPSFDTPLHEWKPYPPSNTPGVRRRRYIRIMKRVVEIDGVDEETVDAVKESQVHVSDENRRRSESLSMSRDYIYEAQKALDRAIGNTNDSFKIAAQHEQAGIELLEKAKNDLDLDRRRRAAQCARVWLECAERGLPGGRRRVALAKAFNTVDLLLNTSNRTEAGISSFFKPSEMTTSGKYDVGSRLSFLGSLPRRRVSTISVEELSAAEPIRQYIEDDEDEYGFQPTIFNTRLQQSAPIPSGLSSTRK